jgi:hypothetical protein
MYDSNSCQSDVPVLLYCYCMRFESSLSLYQYTLLPICTVKTAVVSQAKNDSLCFFFKHFRYKSCLFCACGLSLSDHIFSVRHSWLFAYNHTKIFLVLACSVLERKYIARPQPSATYQHFVGNKVSYSSGSTKCFTYTFLYSLKLVAIKCSA